MLSSVKKVFRVITAKLLKIVKVAVITIKSQVNKKQKIRKKHLALEVKYGIIKTQT